MISSCIVDAAHGSPVRAFLKTGVEIYRCPSCSCIMADVEFVHHQYEADSYYTMSQPDSAAIDREWGFRWRHVLRTIRRYSSAPHARILDVGAGNGYFVYLARSEFGFEADGFEISDAETNFARKTFGVEFLRRESAVPAAGYDVVCSFNVLEHVTQPMALISQMERWLAPGGHLVLTTPSPACIHRRLLGLRGWSMVCPPHHINLFTLTALKELLARARFDILEHSTLSTYIRAVRNLDTRGLHLRRAAFRLLKLAHLGADHFVVCRKSAQLS